MILEATGEEIMKSEIEFHGKGRMLLIHWQGLDLHHSGTDRQIF